MKICLVYPALPPQLDGIGDYTARLAVELTKTASVSILTGTGSSNEPIPEVEIISCFSAGQPRSVREIVALVRERKPDWLLLQYNPFSFGRWGLNLHLPRAIVAALRASPATKLAIMVHEPFMPAISVKAAIMSVYQRWQLFALGRAADIVFFSIESWTERFRSWFPRQTVKHLPVSSNIPLVPTSREAARARWSLHPETVVLGLFGTAGGGRMLPLIKQAAELLLRKGLKVCVAYVGPDGAAVRQALGPVPVLDCGALPASEASQAFAAFDVYLAPFHDGVSTRRTNFMTALQHGCATVATRGPLTDSMLAREHDRAFLLTDVTEPEQYADQVWRLAADPALRERLGKAAAALFEREFSWPRIAQRLREELTTKEVG